MRSYKALGEKNKDVEFHLRNIGETIVDDGLLSEAVVPVFELFSVDPLLNQGISLLERADLERQKLLRRLAVRELCDVSTIEQTVDEVRLQIHASAGEKGNGD